MVSGAQIRKGAGESGKSTVLKQMKLIYASGFSKSEREECRTIIFSNIVHAFKVILEAMDDLDIKFANPDNEVRGFPYSSISIHWSLGLKVHYDMFFTDLWPFRAM